VLSPRPASSSILSLLMSLSILILLYIFDASRLTTH
jgi:hypothetical protein